MAVVSASLLKPHLAGKAARLFNLLERDEETQAYLKMANVMAVSRLVYNDHGVVHSRIVAGSALEILSIFMREGLQPSMLKDDVGDEDDVRAVVLCGAYLHDVGNAVHRDQHELHGCLIASRILDKLLPKIYKDRERMVGVKQEILHCIFSHDEEVKCLSLEAGVVKVADGTDMAEGRARIPYRIGKVDIHSLSALAIKSVEIERGEERPLRILVHMVNPAGVFQIEQVLGRKVETSGIKHLIEVLAVERGKRIKTIIR